MPANKVADVLKVNGVAAVQTDALNQPQDDNTEFIGAKAVWPSLGGSSKAGSNVIVGVIDSGIWPENPMVSPDGHRLADDRQPPVGLRVRQRHRSEAGSAFACNKKLIGAYAFTDTYLANVGSDGHEFCDDDAGVCSPRDSEGHGTHTLTTAAGVCTNTALLYGVDRGPVCGIAPGAHVIAYRVCLVGGCFSLRQRRGRAAGDPRRRRRHQLLDLGRRQPVHRRRSRSRSSTRSDAGISVNASAGNSGPGAATSDHGGPWVTTVGASTGPRFFTTTLHLTADGGATYNTPGVTITNGISSPTPVILAPSIPGEDALCQSTLAAGTATGKIVLCQRGVNGRIDKGRKVSRPAALRG